MLFQKKDVTTVHFIIEPNDGTHYDFFITPMGDNWYSITGNSLVNHIKYPNMIRLFSNFDARRVATEYKINIWTARAIKIALDSMVK